MFRNELGISLKYPVKIRNSIMSLHNDDEIDGISKEIVEILTPEQMNLILSKINNI